MAVSSISGEQTAILVEALQRGACPCWVHNAAHTTDIEALRRIALWYAKWNNDVRVSALDAIDVDPSPVQTFR